MSDAVLTIESLGLIGEKYLELSIGTKGASILPKDGSAVIKGQGVGGLQKVGSTIAETAEEFRKALKDMSSFISSTQFKKSVVKSFRTFAKFNSSGSILFKELQNKIKELEVKNINTASEELVSSLKKTKDTLDSFNQFVNESKKVIGELKDLQEVINGLKSISDKTNAILTKIAQGEGTLGELVNSKDFYFTIKNTFGKFDTTLTTLSDKLNSAISSFSDSMNEIRGVVKDIKTGKGTVGKLTYDEEAYKKVLSLMENIEISFESLRKTSEETGKFIAEVQECPDIIVWGREKSTCKNKNNEKTIRRKRN